MSKTFMTLSQKDCLAVYKEILANSDTKWKSGEKLAEVGDFGSAIAQQIISIEELVKAIILILDGRGFRFRKMSSSKMFFRDHQIRYFIAYLFLIFEFLKNEMVSLLIQMNNNLKRLEEISKDPYIYFAGRKYHYLRSFVELKNDLKTFEGLDKLRQDGMYCDFEDSLRRPLDIDENLYTRINEKLTVIKTIGGQFIEAYQTVDQKIVYQVMKINKKQIKDNFYVKLDEFLQTLRRKKESPFSSFRKIFLNA